MLQRLHITNYAIIEEIIMDLSPQLNIITGETGAGKSILMGALSLILGQRADSNALLNKEKKCVVEGFFDIKNNTGVLHFLKHNDLDADLELVIRREIAVSGKSRAFVNDIPVTLVQLQELSNMLVDLHQQFDTHDIGESSFQREVLDALSGNEILLTQYEQEFKQWQEAQKKLSQLLQAKEVFNKEFDFYQFQYNELTEANFKENELENLDAELLMLSHSENIKTALDKVYTALKENETPVTQLLKQLVQQLSAYKDMHQDIPTVTERLLAAQIELADIADDVETISNKIIFDPERIEIINERTALGYKLLKKHSLNSTASLLQLQQELEQKLQAVLNIDESIATTEKTVAQFFDSLIATGNKLSAARNAQKTPLEEKVNQLLVRVGMPNARLKITITPLKEPASFGLDDIEFLFDANKSNQFAPVYKVASGGELSRLMLCIKSLVAQSVHLPTLIFDEIDTGISGEAAKQVGGIMKDLSMAHQVICITHQPQIAGKANAHFYVYKEIISDTVKTNIRLLSQDERITAIAKMLSGEKPTVAALENAREMMN